jgi:hypothetical protein
MPREGGIELGLGRGQHPTGALDPGFDLDRRQRTLPAGVRIDEDQRCDELRVPPEELQDERAAPGEPADVDGSEREGLDQPRQGVGVVAEAEVSGHVGRAARAGFVPSDDRELIGQGGQLGLPDSAVLRRP